MPIDDIVSNIMDSGELYFSRGDIGTVTEIMTPAQVMLEIPAVSGGGLTSYGFGSA
jgi:hypothetical protein